MHYGILNMLNVYFVLMCECRLFYLHYDAEKMYI